MFFFKLLGPIIPKLYSITQLYTFAFIQSFERTLRKEPRLNLHIDSNNAERSISVSPELEGSAVAMLSMLANDDICLMGCCCFAEFSDVPFW